jgi:hypothetical protein
MTQIRILAATGVLASGFREDSLARGMSWKPDFIGVDSGSTDSGPYYLGSGESHFSDAAYYRDLRLILLAARRARIPAIVGSAGTAGADVHVDRIAGIARQIARDEGLSFKLAVIYSQQDPEYLVDKLREGRITPLRNAPQISEARLRGSSRIVGMAGVEPFIEALDNGADVVICGRSSDTSIFAAIPTMRGLNPAPVWHAAKILECGAAAVVRRKHPDPLFAVVDDDGFTIEPPNPDYRCDPISVASHNLYENATPYELIEPSGVLNTFNARYEAASDRAVRVTGSTFEPSERYTIKLEGAELAGYQSFILGGVRDPVILRQLDSWLEGMQEAIRGRWQAVFGTEIESRCRLDLRVYGRDAVMGALETASGVGHEVGIVVQVTAETQELASALIRSAGHIAVHFPVPEWTGLITGLAFPYSPAEIDRGPAYQFNLHHVVEPANPLEMFRMTWEMVS